VGNRPPSEKKIANPRGYARRGGMVTGRIEPWIRAKQGRRTLFTIALCLSEKVLKLLNT